MAGLQEGQSHVNMATESDDEVEKLSLGIRTKFQVCLNGVHNSECGKSEGKVTKHFRPVNNEPKNLSVKPYYGPGRHAKCGNAVNKLQNSDGKMTLIVDDTRFVVDRNIFDSQPNTMLARCVYKLFRSVDI